MNDQTQTWNRDGYFVVHGLFDGERTERLRETCESIIHRWRTMDPGTRASIEQIGGAKLKNERPPEAVSMRHPNHPAYLRRGQADRETLLEAAADPALVDTCGRAFSEAVLYRAMNLFMNPLEGGRDGHWHRDSQFLWKEEEEERRAIGEMSPSGTSVQVQIALVPSSDFEVVPGSHIRWDTPDEYAIRRKDGGRDRCSNAMPGAIRVALEKGDALGFNPVILHRGRYHSDRPRRTLLVAYTPLSQPRADRFSFQPWFLESGSLDGLSDPARGFFEQFVAQYKDEWSVWEGEGKQ